MSMDDLEKYLNEQFDISLESADKAHLELGSMWAYYIGLVVAYSNVLEFCGYDTKEIKIP